MKGGPRAALAALLLVCSAASVEARPVRWFVPSVIIGAQHVAPVKDTFTRPEIGLSSLLLWPLPRRASVQVQWIHPIRRTSRPLLRLAVDVCVWGCR